MLRSGLARRIYFLEHESGLGVSAKKKPTKKPAAPLYGHLWLNELRSTKCGAKHGWTSTDIAKVNCPECLKVTP